MADPLAVYEDVPQGLEAVLTTYRRLHRVVALLGPSPRAAAQLTAADARFEALRPRASRTHPRADLDALRFVDHLVFRAEEERRALARTTEALARETGWAVGSLALPHALEQLVKTRAQRRANLNARRAIFLLRIVLWPTALAGLAAVPLALDGGWVGVAGMTLALPTLPVAVAAGVAILALRPAGLRTPLVQALVAVSAAAFVVVLLIAFP